MEEKDELILQWVEDMQNECYRENLRSVISEYLWEAEAHESFSGFLKNYDCELEDGKNFKDLS